MSPQRHEPEDDDNVEVRRRVSIIEAELVDTKAMREDIRAIRTAIVGDEALGHRGLVSRLTIAERLIYILAALALVMGGERMIHLLMSAAG